MVLDTVIMHRPAAGQECASQAIVWCANNLGDRDWTIVCQSRTSTCIRLFNRNDLALLILSVNLGEYRVYENTV